MKLSTRIVLAIAIVAAGAAAVWMYYRFRPAAEGSPEYRKIARQYSEKMGRGPGRLKAGDPAPDFRLKRLHSEDSVQLATLAGKKPVALIFGSYT